MQKKCDICGKRIATLADRVVENGWSKEYAYCEACYTHALKCGAIPSEEAAKRLARRGKECEDCGCTVESFNESLMFGCAQCYRDMRGIAADAVRSVQRGFDRLHNFSSDIVIKSGSNVDGFKRADECSASDLVRHNVVSSRIRLARNLEGVVFPQYLKGANMRTVEIIKAAERASVGVFDASVLTMSGLSKNQKKVLLERHIISLPLANNVENGALIIENGDRPQISVMINEEDHLREQCVVDGHNLEKAYIRISKYDENINSLLSIAYDKRFGYLTACPTNVGTGMRASEMLYLPALRRTGAIDDTLKRILSANGLTARGYFGEGSEYAYDMYQISNAHTYGVSETEIIRQVEQAALRICYCERVALEKLIREQNTALFDGIFRSYGVLTSAFSLTAQELMKLLVDVKLGVILGVLPIKSTALLNSIIEQCSSSIEIIGEKASADERNKARARIVQRTLAEAKC